jgi:TPR repeat protein
MRHGIGQGPLAGALAALHDDSDLSIPDERKDDTMRKLLASLFVSITLGMAQGANAGPLEDGEAAVSKGDYATALSLFRPLAAQGNAQAQVLLGIMYDHGQGVPRDYKEAVKWYRLAAAQGNAFAQGLLGFMYQYGDGVVQNYVRAHMWFLLSAANDSKASPLRDEVAKKLNSAQIQQATEMAQRCQASSYKQCG